MKSKKMIYLLIGCVAVVWGMIIYRIYVQVKPGDELQISQVKQKPISIAISNHSNDAYQLYLDRDPFVSYSFVSSVAPAIQNTGQAKVSTAAKIITPVAWPAINYSGYIKNPKSNQKITIISLNGKEIMLRDGEVAQGVKLIKNYGDSIQLSFMQTTKHLKL